jgi:hypothetical protein
VELEETHNTVEYLMEHARPFYSTQPGD